MFKNVSPDLVVSGRTRQIWVSGPVRSGNSYAQSAWALQCLFLHLSLEMLKILCVVAISDGLLDKILK